MRSPGHFSAQINTLVAEGRWSEIHAGCREPAAAAAGDLVCPFAFDLGDEGSIATALARIGGPLDLVIVATGMLQDEGAGIRPERSLRAIDPEAMGRVLAVNAIGPALIAKHALPLLARGRRAVFAALSARVGSLADNRLGGWHSYRASKAALNMLITGFAIEMARTHPQAVILGLHPGTVDSRLSAPFQRGLRPGQLLAPDESASRLLAVLSAASVRESGKCLDHQGKVIPA